MLAFNHLGRLGQLGNQMFQYAALKGIAERHGYDFMIPNNKDVMVDSLGNKLRTEIFNPFDLNVKVGILQTENYLQEPHYEYSVDLVNNCPDNFSLWGFFQTEKYFKHIEDKIRKDFTFKKQIRDECKEIIEEVFDNPIALHVRRGDFLINHANHHNLSMDYYAKALSKFDKKRQVVVFTDDPKWAFEQELFADDRFIISNEVGPYHDLYLMTQCDDFIIANSTFSWWGAWLANRGTVIAPKKWFGPNNIDKNIDDLYPPHWKLL